MFLLLTLNIFYTFSVVSVGDVEQVNVSWIHENDFQSFEVKIAVVKNRYKMRS